MPFARQATHLSVPARCRQFEAAQGAIRCLSALQSLIPPFFSVKLQAIHRFTSTAAAVEDITSIGEGKVSKSLKEFLRTEISENKKFKNEKLAVSDTKLGTFLLPFFARATLTTRSQLVRSPRSSQIGRGHV